MKTNFSIVVHTSSQVCKEVNEEVNRRQDRMFCYLGKLLLNLTRLISIIAVVPVSVS
jgi:hypothetical protein